VPRLDRAALAVVAAVALAAGWATRAGTLPAPGSPLLGGALQATAWAVIALALGLTFDRVARARGASGRSVWWRVGVALLLALLTTDLCRVLSASALAPARWKDYYYLGRVVPLVFVGVWGVVLLPRRRMQGRAPAVARPGLAPLPQLVVLFVAAAALVSCADLAFLWLGDAGDAAHVKGDIILRSAWVGNTLIVFSAYALAFALTADVSAALLLVTPLYAGLGFATLVKIEYMHVAVQPLDLIRLPEFLPFFRSFFGVAGIVGAAVAFGVWAAALATSLRRARAPVPPRRRWLTGLLALGILLGVPAAFFAARHDARARRMLTRLGAPGDPWREQARRHGFLLSFLAEMPIAFVAAPRDYSPATVARAARRYWSAEAGRPTRRGGVNLIVYLVESFMDPDDLGLRFSADPTPNVRALRATHIGGHSIVPEAFGGSVNTEFELLTGMSTAFLPEGSLVYRQYLRHAIPSLPRTLGDAGYTTIAIQADPRFFFDRERVYGLLGFDRTVWLREQPGVELAPRAGWPSDDAMVRAVIRESQGPRPFFIFAFPSSTHSPYNFGVFGRSDLRVLDSASKDADGEVKEYITALRGADRAVAALIDHFRQRPDSTIIVVLGDHIPPLPKDALRGLSAEVARTASDAEREWKVRRVPLLVWANFDLPRDSVELSVNALPAFLLEKIGVRPSGFLALTDRVRHDVPVLTNYARDADGRAWPRDSLPDGAGALIDDYRLLEYDLLLGERYALQGAPASAPRPAGHASPSAEAASR
jgi:hypothetical protein